MPPQKKTEQQILETNYYLAKAYEQKIKIAIDAGDKNKDITEYRKAWLYALEAESMNIPEGKKALKQLSLNQVTHFSINALTPSQDLSPPSLNIGTAIKAIAYSPDGSVLASGL